jgi:hypothetical protein
MSGMSDHRHGDVETSSSTRLRSRIAIPVSSPPAISSWQRLSLQSPPVTRKASEQASDEMKEGKGQDDLDLASELPGALRWRNIIGKNGDVNASRASPGPILTNIRRDTTKETNDHASIYPPSFAQSEFETIIRRQRTNPNGLKIINIPLRFPTLDNDWEFVVST